MMHPDDLAKRVQVPVIVKDGVLVGFYTNKPVELKDGAIGDLIMPEWAVKEQDVLRKLTSERFELFLPKGTQVYFEVDMNQARSVDAPKPDFLAEDLAGKNGFTTGQRDLVVVVLREDLDLILRSTKKARLASCKCYIPALIAKASSLNEAFRVISQVYEPKRRSFGGNVFKHGWIINEKGVWVRLDRVRDGLEAVQEEELFEVSKQEHLKDRHSLTAGDQSAATEKPKP